MGAGVSRPAGAAYGAAMTAIDTDAEYGLTEAVRRLPDKIALVCGDETRTYAEFDARSSAIARVLASRGVGDSDRVAIMLPNSIEYFEAWSAIGKLKASVVLVNWHLKADELAYILNDSGAKVLISHASLESGFHNAITEVPDCLLVVGGEPGDADDFETAVASAPSTPESFPPQVTLASPVFYTSGTTGRPKGVIHGLYDDEVSRAATMGQVMLWRWNEDDVYIVSGPAYHAGPGGWAMAAFFVGATTVVLPSWNAREWLALVEKHRVTKTFMVPAHFIRLLEVPAEEFEKYDTSSLVLIAHAGAPCPVPVKEKIIAALAPTEIWEIYGASEGGATIIAPDDWLAHPGTVGKPWPGTEVRILDEAGNPQPPGTPGLVYTAPANGHRFEYHEDQAKTEEAWLDGAFTVGDVGYIDADGYLYLTDRASDMVIRGGVNVYPREIENVLYTHPAVVDCAVFGIPDDRLGEQLKAVVELREPASTEDLTAFMREHLADFKVPAVIDIVDELPRQPNGKVLKRVLRDQHWQGRDTKIG
jgi:long-chain acyl-CoA synthetase